MATGSLLTAFGDFAQATTLVKVSGRENVINDAQNRTFILGWLTRGDRGMKKMIHSGKTVDEFLMFDEENTFGWHRIGATQRWVNPQVLRKVSVELKFAVDHMTWARQEIILNEKVRYGNSDMVMEAFVDILHQKERRLMTSHWNGMDNSMTAEPNVERMERNTADAPQPGSIFMWVNEATNGLFLPLDGGTSFTTVGGIDPTASGYERFVPAQRTYDSAAINDPGNIFSAFDQMWKDIRFEKPPSQQEYFTDPRYNNQTIFTSSVGHSVYGQQIRLATSEGFHSIAGSQDPAVPDPMYFGIPVVWHRGFDTATVYANTGGDDTVTEGTAANIGPRFYWLNSNFLFPVFHDEIYFSKDEPRQDYTNIDEYVMPVSTWMSTLCTSRARQGVVSPNGSLFTELYS
jgi:hypothetical protein